jgi:hypothetical protein
VWRLAPGRGGSANFAIVGWSLAASSGGPERRSHGGRADCWPVTSPPGSATSREDVGTPVVVPAGDRSGPPLATSLLDPNQGVSS